MTRWQQAYKNHQFSSQLVAARNATEKTTLTASAPAVMVEELARLAKALAYLEGQIETLDLDLIPPRKWDEAAPQLSAFSNELLAFSTDQTLEHLQAANSYLDGVLEVVRPLVPFVSKGTRTYARSVSEQARIASEHLETATRIIGERLAAIETYATKAEAAERTATTIIRELRASAADVLGSENTPGILQKTKAILEDVEDSQSNITDYYNDLFSDEGDEPSKKSSIDAALSQARQAALDATSTASAAKKSTASLDEFYTRTFGTIGEDGKRSGGIDSELEALKGRLVDFQGKQELRYKALNDQIESLLPGATSAGLASAYSMMKESFERPVMFFSRAFFVAIAVLVSGSIILHFNAISSAGVEFVDITKWDQVLKSLVYKLPFYGPAVWLAYYASKRRSEYQRLQQEYAHKEALAKSYDSYKKQIEELDLEDNELMKQLLTKAIDAVSYNASQTLDGKHGDKMPSHELIGYIEKMLSKQAG